MKKIFLSIIAASGMMFFSCDETDNPVSPSLSLDRPAPTFKADADTLRPTKDGATFKINVTQNTSYKWTAVSSQTAWCTLDVAATDSLSGSKILTVTVEPYQLVNPRSANITLKEVGNRTITLRVMQSGADPAIAVAPVTITVNNAEGGVENIVVTGNCAWTAASNAAWCTVSPASGDGNGSVNVTITRNITEQATRTATVTFNAVGLTRTVTVTQNGTTYIPPQPPDNTTTIYFEDLVIGASNNTVGNQWTLTDRRDAKTYKVRLMEDNRAWMIADLRFGGVPDIVAAKNTFTGNSETVVGKIGDFIPDYYGDIVNITFNGSADINPPRANRGYFYNWMAALQKADVSDGAAYEKAQGICPAGWHVPARSEFATLRTAFGSLDGSFWGEDTGSKFNGVWGGDIDGGTRRNWGLGNYGYYWSSTKNANNNAVAWCVNKPGNDVTNANIYLEDNPGGVAEPAKKNKNGGALVRCVRD